MQKKIACINDISGIGKCSLTVALPIISALKCQCCPVPTSVLSSQTGYPKFTFVDLSDSMESFVRTWKELNQNIDTIYSGFLGSVSQISTVENIIDMFENAFVVVDPVLGDNGARFPIFDGEFVREMRRLVAKSDMITPNITEANLLLDISPDELSYSDQELLDLCRKLVDLGPKHIIITGFLRDGMIYNICYTDGDSEVTKIGSPYNEISFSGTGDIFTSIITALFTRGFDLNESVKVASNFISSAVDITVAQDFYDRNDGVNFEYILDKLVEI